MAEQRTDPDDVTTTTDVDNGDFYDTLVAMPGNSVCCDCGSSNNTWASTNLGVVVCNECVGAHRSLGVHISKPLSLKMDIWDEEQRAHILARGNEKVNAELEAHPETSQHKPPPDAPIEAKAAFVRAKVGCPLSFVLLPPSSLSRAQRRECNVAYHMIPASHTSSTICVISTN